MDLVITEDLPPGTYTLEPKVTIPPPPPPPPQTGVFWVYQNGKFNWPGDFSFEATIDYADTAGIPMHGLYDVAVHITSRWGAWQPFSFLPGGTPFDTTPYKYLIYSVKPTVAGQIIATGFDADNDVADGIPVVVAGPGITQYGPVPQPGVWNSYKIPLADFGLTNKSILKFTVADGSGSAALFFVDDVGFSAT